MYRVQVGAYSRKENAENMVKKLKESGFDAVLIKS
ncbi:MAG: SPOR domain-containing protein [Methanobrevibacter sp.]|nr:SPOR domain-containing protein [Methanobrevibacter sp.]